jgi:trans-aconitate 2-methyltransferase
LARVHLERARFVVDLGCAPGNSTSLLRTRFAGTRVVGVDNSEEMLKRAREDLPEIEWTASDVRTFCADAVPDLIFANAVLQWLPEHEILQRLS